MPDRRVARYAAALTVLAVAIAGCSTRSHGSSLARPPAPASPSAAAPSATPSAAPAPANLKVIDYSRAPGGFPADPEPASTARLTEGLHPTEIIPAYDAPGGKPKAFLAPVISGVTLVMPIVQRRDGWVAVLLPSANRTIGWLPAGGWERVQLRDQLVLKRQAFSLTWLRDGVEQHTWTVTVGMAKSPTPLGRSFVLGRSKLPGKEYAGLDVLALGSVPDDENSVPTGLRGAHTGIHSWYRNNFGGFDSNGCIRLPQDGQRLLLEQLAPGTAVIVLP